MPEEIIQLEEPKNDRIKQTRADFTYDRPVKELKDVVYFPVYKSEIDSYCKIIEHYERK
jgi:hypothetical protein